VLYMSIISVVVLSANVSVGGERRWPFGGRFYASSFTAFGLLSGNRNRAQNS